MIFFLNFLAFTQFGMQAGARVTRTLGNNVVRRQLKPLVDEPIIYDWKNIGGTAEAGTINYRESNFRVALSGDGSTVAVGSPLVNESRGQVRVSRLKNASSDEWVPMGLDITGDEQYSLAGTSLSLSKDGTVLAVGFPAYFDAYPQRGTINTDSCARVYKWNQTLDDWEQLGSNVFDIRIFPYPEEPTFFMTTQAGWSISLSDDGMTLAVGAPLHLITGQVRVYHFNDNNPATGWVEIGKPISKNSIDGWLFGFSVSLSGDAMILAIGDPYARSWSNNNATSSGNTRIFKWNETQDDWGALGNIIVGGGLTGFSVSLSTDGNTLAVGHPGSFLPLRGGLVRVYHINDNSSHWDQIGSDILSAYTDLDWWENSFGDGRSVFLSGDGQTVAIAAPSMSFNCVTHGLVRVFRLTNTTNSSVIMMDWDQLGKPIAGELRMDGDGSDGTDFVSLSSDGNRLVVGAPIHGNTPYTHLVSHIVNWTGHVRIFDLIEVLPTVAPTASSSPSISFSDPDSSASPSSPDNSAAFSKRRPIFTLVLIVTLLAFVL
jgi:hypothetical protein